MSEKDLQDRSTGAPPGEQPARAEAKRLDARRRFVKNTAAGSSAVLFTLYHTKGSAGTGKKVVLSSAQACMSLGGTPGKRPIKVKDSVTGKKVEKVECHLP
jgi:hypothetical protein